MANLVKKDVSYMGRDFATLRENLKNFIKVYFQNNYQDFSDSSVGMMLMEMAAYVGDVLNFYMDKQFKELYIDTMTERRSAINLANMFGYKVLASTPSNTYLDFYVTVPATGAIDNKVPDYRYCPIIKKGVVVNSATTPSVPFEITRDLNFNVNMSGSLFEDGREEIIYEVDENNIPTKFLLRKKIAAVGAETAVHTQVIGAAQRYLKIQLPDNNVTEIVSVVDSDGNNWYEVESLAQDTIFIAQENNITNNPQGASDSTAVPYVLKLKKVPKRFEVRVDENNLTYLIFGAGTNTSNDEEVIPSPANIASPYSTTNFLDYAIDPEDFLNMNTYGEAPNNTILTITYRRGGGIESNVPANTITRINNLELDWPVSTNQLDLSIMNEVKNSISCTNESPAIGGSGMESTENIKLNAIKNFKAQRRCVTKDDYIVRTYSLPPRFGRIAKVYIEKDEAVSENSKSKIANPFDLNLYILSYDSEKHLIAAPMSLKQNLKTYLSQYRIITDNINIVDGGIINIGLVFEVIAFPNENKNEVLMRCISALKEYFNIDKWNFNQPIVYSELYRLLMDVKGVQSIPLDFNLVSGQRRGINITCKAGGDYSNNRVNIEGLTRDGIIYPPRGVFIFEVKYPDIDIIGRVI